MATTSTRMTADERREMLIEAASIEFAAGGLHGTSTDDIARRAGISQPYLFRLFRTKKELFLAAIDRCFDQTTEVFAEAARQAGGEDTLQQMGLAYCGLLRDRPKLMMQMQTYAACDDPDVRARVQARYGELFRFVEEVAGATPEQVREWFAIGMLLNVVAAMDMPSLDETWPRRLLGDLLQEW